MVSFYPLHYFCSNYRESLTLQCNTPLSFFLGHNVIKMQNTASKWNKNHHDDWGYIMMQNSKCHSEDKGKEHSVIFSHGFRSEFLHRTEIEAQCVPSWNTDNFRYLGWAQFDSYYTQPLQTNQKKCGMKGRTKFDGAIWEIELAFLKEHNDIKIRKIIPFEFFLTYNLT